MQNLTRQNGHKGPQVEEFRGTPPMVKPRQLRREHIRVLQQALETGSYAISCAQLADCLMKYMLAAR